MPVPQRRRQVGARNRRRKLAQRGGLLSLLDMAIPALMAVGKAAALGGVAGAAGDAVKKALRKKTMRGYKITWTNPK